MDRWLHLICQELNFLVPPEPVRDHCRATGLIERHRRIDAPLFLWTFLVDTTQHNRSVSAGRDLYTVFTGHDIAYSSIQQWITLELVELLVDLVDYLSVELGGIESSLGGRYGCHRRHGRKWIWPTAPDPTPYLNSTPEGLHDQL